MASQITLVRHGETAWSLTGRHTGRTDLPLIAQGEQRASRTCELAGFGGVARPEPDFQEWDYGTYEGLTTEEIHAKQPGWDVFQHGGPQGESVGQVTQRADRMVATLRALDGTVVVFSHGHFLRALAMRWIGRPLSAGRHFPLETAAVSMLGYEHPDRKIPAITLWNSGADLGLACCESSLS